MALIPERLWNQMTEDERALVQETVQGIRRKGREIICPHCCEVVRIATTFTVVAKHDDSDTPSLPAEVKPFTSVEMRVLEAAKTSGLMDAFAATVKAEKEHSGIPANLDAFFLAFWRLAEPIKVSAVILAAWAMEFGGRIEALQSNGIVAVLSDGELVEFVPNRLTQPVKTAKGNAPRLSNTASFEMWTKGKFGYVPVGARAFTQALRQGNVGKFGTLVQ